MCIGIQKNVLNCNLFSEWKHVYLPTETAEPQSFQVFKNEANSFLSLYFPYLFFESIRLMFTCSTYHYAFKLFFVSEV